MKNWKKLFELGFILLFVGLIFKPFFFDGKLPIPADTIVGMYNPWHDVFLKVLFKNFLITDPVRQQFPWRQLSIELLKNKTLPLWNPYTFSGTPLLANVQSAAFYPLNIIYWFTNFSTGWSVQVILQVVFGGLFMALLLKFYKLHPYAVTLGVLAWISSGFFVAWLEWNTVIQVVLWLPLILLCIEKIFLIKYRWILVMVLALVCSLLAGHLQTSFYVLTTATLYLLYKTWETKNLRLGGLGMVGLILSLVITLPFWLPVFQFVFLSARNIDLAQWQRSDWFLPWQNLAQLIAPDFFGNPATLNYFGIWNYGEFVSYVGLIPLFFAIFAMFAKNRQTLFYFGLVVLALVFALPTPLAKIPFVLNIPFLSTAQPSRLISLIDFSLAVLAAFGLDQFLKAPDKKRVIVSTGLVGIAVLILWMAAYAGRLDVSLRNLVFPSLIFFLTASLLLVVAWKNKFKNLIVGALLIVALIDSTRFVTKFESFSSPEYLFPQTQLISYLQKNTQDGVYRIATGNDQIMPPNFNIPYKLQTISGYDPLYLKNYGELIYAMQNKTWAIPSNLGFNRILIPNDYTNKLFDLLGVKYFLTNEEIKNPQYQKVLNEGITNVYLNKNVVPRTFFVKKIVSFHTKTEILEFMLSGNFIAGQNAVVEDYKNNIFSTVGNSQIEKYSENEVIIRTENLSDGFLVLTDAYYPTWQAEIDGVKTRIYLTDYAFRGINIPAGQHVVRFFIR